jgi:hypothetical protein
MLVSNRVGFWSSQEVEGEVGTEGHQPITGACGFFFSTLGPKQISPGSIEAIGEEKKLRARDQPTCPSTPLPPASSFWSTRHVSSIKHHTTFVQLRFVVTRCTSRSTVDQKQPVPSTAFFHRGVVPWMGVPLAIRTESSFFGFALALLVFVQKSLGCWVAKRTCLWRSRGKT